MPGGFDDISAGAQKAESRVGTCLQGDGVPSSTAWQTLGAGLTGSVILPTTSTAQSMPEALPKTKSTVSRGRSTVIASDPAMVAETTAGKSAASRLEHPNHISFRSSNERK